MSAELDIAMLSPWAEEEALVASWEKLSLSR